MISITIDRSVLGLLPLSITDTGADSYSLMPGFSLGGWTPDNTYAESRWIDGAAMTSSRLTMSAMELNLRVEGVSLTDLQANVDALATAVGQFTYTVTVTEGTTVTDYDCCSGSVRRAYNQTAMLNLADYVQVQIPRQP